jgi:GR25 family glycosyltransferase involved in LPS biosynthesis
VLKTNLEAMSSVKKMLIDKKIISPQYNYDNIGTVACYLSHMKALQTFLESDEKNKTAVIFEDDIQLCQDKQFYEKRVASLSHELKNILHWDVLLLGSCWSSCLQMKSITKQMWKGGDPLCSHAYVVTRHSARIIVQQGFPIIVHFDEMIKRLGENGILKTIAVMPPIFFQNRKTLGSTIGNDDDLCCCKENMKYDFSIQISVIIPYYGIIDPKKINDIIYKLQHCLEIGEIIVSHEKRVDSNYYNFEHAKNIVTSHLNSQEHSDVEFFIDISQHASNNIALVVLDVNTIPTHEMIQTVILKINKNPKYIYSVNSKLLMGNTVNIN